MQNFAETFSQYARVRNEDFEMFMAVEEQVLIHLFLNIVTIYLFCLFRPNSSLHTGLPNYRSYFLFHWPGPSVSENYFSVYENSFIFSHDIQSQINKASPRLLLCSESNIEVYTVLDASILYEPQISLISLLLALPINNSQDTRCIKVIFVQMRFVTYVKHVRLALYIL